MGDQTFAIGSSQADHSMLEDITSKISLMLSQTPSTTIHEPVPLGIQLDDMNYELWSQVAQMYISAKDKWRYINGDLQLPP